MNVGAGICLPDGEFYASDVMGTIRDLKNSSCPQKRMQESSRQYQNMHSIGD